MSDAQIETPRDYLIETIATLLLGVGGYKDAAEATLVASDLFEDLTSTDPQDVAQAATDLRKLAIQADGVANAMATDAQDDADESVRFVKDEGEALPEGDVAPGPQSFADLLQGIFGPGATIIPFTPGANPFQPNENTAAPRFDLDGPANDTPEGADLEIFMRNPFGGFTRVG